MPLQSLVLLGQTDDFRSEWEHKVLHPHDGTGALSDSLPLLVPGFSVYQIGSVKRMGLEGVLGVKML